jgi:hypothetical protein
MTLSQPFVFHGCAEVRELLGYDANDARELLEQLQRVPGESIFCHMAGVMLHRAVLPEAYPNDFAVWSASALRDRRLAERLAIVDPFRSGSVEAVRGELVATIEDHLRHLSAPQPASKTEPFSFFRLHLVPVPTGHQAKGLEDFRDALAEVDVSALFYHIIEARYRLGRGRGDFAEWVASALNRPGLADRLAQIDPYVGTLERIRDRHLIVVNQALEEGSG